MGKTIRTVWRWKANVQDYINQPNVVGVYVAVAEPSEYQCLVGRSGYVGFIETVPDKKEASNEN